MVRPDKFPFNCCGVNGYIVMYPSQSQLDTIGVGMGKKDIVNVDPSAGWGGFFRVTVIGVKITLFVG